MSDYIDAVLTPLLTNVVFSDLFPVSRPYVAPAKGDATRRTFKAGCTRLSTYCSGHARGAKSLLVEPSQMVIDAIANYAVVNGGGMYFEIIPFPDDNYCRVFAKYEQIIGSKMLAIVPLDSLPEYAYKKEEVANG